ncbi:hypothetical protein J3R82DRAFT_9199 [Butyriboletus roseoflavus]|nr:hypothetical protein J3R82DRAFT_9199 [Butyriboletus roseoflavus]
MASFFRIYKFVKGSHHSLYAHSCCYSAALIQRPMIAQSATAAFLFGTGDIIAQQAIERQGKNHDFMRTIPTDLLRRWLLAPLRRWRLLIPNAPQVLSLVLRSQNGTSFSTVSSSQARQGV